MAALIKIAVVTFVVIGACCIVAVMVVPPIGASAAIRDEDTLRLILMLDSATHAHRLTEGHYPMGDGQGSAELVRALSKSRECGRPYVSFSPAMLTAEGDVRSPAGPEGEIVHYRDNTRLRADVREAVAGNAGGFDLWARDSEGRVDGISNAAVQRER